MHIIQHPSPNHDTRAGHAVDMLVLHYTGMKTASDALERMCDTASQVSAHYMVDVDGEIFQLVKESERAWHAGVSSWRGHTNINQRSIGIEVVNPGHEFGYTPFPAVQMQVVGRLAGYIINRHHIPARNIVGHSDVAPMRKQDPGELFDWPYLARHVVGLFPGIGLVPAPVAVSLPASVPTEAEVLAALARFGYDITDAPATITAFQRRFRPKNLSGTWDSECQSLLNSLLAALS